MNTSRKALLGLAPLLVLVAGAACTSAPADEGTTSEDFGTVAAPGHVTLKDVQAAIKAKGTGWTAGTTSVSKLSLEKRAGHFGVPSRVTNTETFTVVEETDAVPIQAMKKTHGSASVDWRNNNGKNWVSPILDQGQCGSCVAFSSVGTFETQLNIAAGTTDSPWELSPEYLFMCGGASCDSGWEPDSAASFITKTGIPDDACFPYTSGALGTDVACSKACSNAKTRAVKAKGFTTPTTGSTNLSAVKAALAKGPLVTTLTVYEDFMYYTSGVYKHTTGDVAGGHAVSIVGYSDADQAWIVRNSWGTDWGMNGFFEIAYTDTSGLSDETWQFTIPSAGPWVSLDGVRDYDLVSGTTNVTFDSSDAGSSFSWTLADKTGKSVATGNATGTTAAIDTTKVADGVYSLTPHAGSTDGEPRIVYVLNGTDKGTVAFKNLKAGQTLTGDVEVQVAVSAAPVPATAVNWTVTDSTGKQIITTSSNAPGSVIEMGWGTARRPNGNYTVTVTALAGTQTLGTASVNVTLKN